MKQANENSSLYIMLFLCVTIVVGAALGWFLLDTDADVEEQAAVATPEPELPAKDVEAGPSEQAVDIDANLRKARIAAAADMLIEPAGQSALFYYSQVIELDSNHAVATAELSTVLSRLAATVGDHLAAEEYAEAYNVAELVSAVRPDHPLVEEVRHTLDTRAAEILEEAMQLARDGDHDGAFAAVDVAAVLPGQDAEYFAAVRATITTMQESQQQAQAEEIRKIEDQRRDFEMAAEAWMQRTRAAINAGRLITPAGSSARDFYAERTLADEYQAEVHAELLEAIATKTRTEIDNDRLEDAQTLIDAAVDMGMAEATAADLRASLEQAHIDAESSRLIPVNELVYTKNVAARYPRTALNRGVSGWVEVIFTVTPSGETTDIEISNAEPEQVFNKAVIDAVSQWEFEPRMFRGQSINQRTVARLVFELQ